MMELRAIGSSVAFRNESSGNPIPKAKALIMSNVWFSPVSGAISDMDTLRNPNPLQIDGSVIDEPPAARSLAVATASGAPIQRLSEHLLFAIFDFVRDGHAFVQSEASCRAFCGLLQSTEGIGRKLWEARPIRYGPIPMPHDENPRLPYMQPPDYFLKGGGRRVVLEFAALQSLDLREEYCKLRGGRDFCPSVVLTFVGPAVWTQVLTELYARCRPPESHLPLLEFSECFVEAAMDIVESSFTHLLQNALKCAVHRGSSMLTAADIELARSILDDTTMPQTLELNVKQARRHGSTQRFSVEALPGISVEAKDRIIRTFVRRVQGLAFNARAYELMWVLLVARLLKLLTRVGEIVLYREDPSNLDQDLAAAPQRSTAEITAEIADRLGLPEDSNTVLRETRAREFRHAMNLVERQADASRRLVLKPLLADLALAAKDDPHAPCYSWAEAWDEIGTEAEVEAETDDDDSSIGSESS